MSDTPQKETSESFQEWHIRQMDDQYMRKLEQENAKMRNALTEIITQVDMGDTDSPWWKWAVDLAKDALEKTNEK